MDRNVRGIQTGVMTTAERIDQAVSGYTVVSRHNTSQGVVSYVRCDNCGALRMVATPAPHGGAPMTAGHHADRCPVCD